MLWNKFSVVRDNDSYVVKVVVPTGASAHLGGMHEFHLRNDIAEYYLCCALGLSRTRIRRIFYC